jgi:hypothetical protein
MDESFQKVWSELTAIYADRREQRPSFASSLKELDIDRWGAYLASSRGHLYDQISLKLARGFADGELDFTFCDAVVNDIHGVITFSGGERPPLFWSVFIAFDNGEYYHDNNRPMIEQILKQIA